MTGCPCSAAPYLVARLSLPSTTLADLLTPLLDANPFYCEDEPGRRTTGKLLTRDNAWRIAVNIAKLPLLRR